MKIIYIAKILLPSRTANSLHVMKMCQAFADNGHEVVLYALSEHGVVKEDVESVYRHYAVKNNFSIVWIPMMLSEDSRLRYLLSSFVLMGSVTRRILFKRVDIVFGRDLLGCVLSALLGKHTIFESHSPIWRGRLESILFKLLIRLPHFSKLVVISDALRQAYLFRYEQLNHTNTLIAHDAADPPPQQAVVSSPLRGDSKQLNIGYVGHLYKGKGMEVVAAVASLLPEMNFHVIGGLEGDIACWKAKVSVSNVFFYGFIKQDELPVYLHSLDVCLLPNQRHVSAYGAGINKSNNISDFTSPLKMFEYMAYKKPIIASDLPVLREVLDEQVALLAPPDDIDAWKAAINNMKNIKLREHLGDAGYALFMKKYTWKKRAKYVLADC